MYTVHFRLIGKLVVNFLLVIIELFLLGVRAEVLRANIPVERGFSLAQNFRSKGSPPPTILRVRKVG